MKVNEIFLSDGANDFLADVSMGICREIKVPQDVVGVETVLAGVEMLICLCKNCGVVGELMNVNFTAVKSGILELIDQDSSEFYKGKTRDLVQKRFDVLIAIIK